MNMKLYKIILKLYMIIFCLSCLENVQVVKSKGLPWCLAIVQQDATAARLHFEAEPEQDHG